MTSLKTLAIAAALAVGLMTIAESASARGRYGHHHHGHHHHGARFSFGFWGGPFWGPGYWGPSYWGPGYGYWGPPSIVVVPQEPRVWVENDPPAAAASAPVPPVAANTNPNAQQWWYWCASANGYYPYVASCSEGWQRVTPQPAQAR